MFFQVISFFQTDSLLTSHIAALLYLHNFIKHVDTSNYFLFSSYLITCKSNCCYIIMLMQLCNHIVASNYFIFWNCFIFSSQFVACNHANCVIASKYFVFSTHFIFWYQNNFI